MELLVIEEDANEVAWVVGGVQVPVIDISSIYHPGATSVTPEY